MNQTREAARQILGNVSDIQATVSMCGITEVNSKLANIREKAAWIYEGDKGVHKIVEGYEDDADQAMATLSKKIEIFLSPASHRSQCTDADRLQIQRLAELVVQRNRVYFERRNRYTVVVGKGTKVVEETHGEQG